MFFALSQIFEFHLIHKCDIILKLQKHILNNIFITSVDLIFDFETKI